MVLLTRFKLSRFLVASLLVQLILTPAFLTAQEHEEWRIYEERNQDGEMVRHHFRSFGLRHELKTEMKSGTEHQVFVVDQRGETTSWEYQDSSRGLWLKALLTSGRRIHLTGNRRGKPVDKWFELNDQPWNQRFQQGLTAFLKGSNEKTVFWAIGTRGKGELRISRFTARREVPDPPPPELKQAGYNGPFHHIKLSLHGMLSIFWSGHYWYDAVKGTFLFYHGKSSHLEGDVVLIKQKQ